VIEWTVIVVARKVVVLSDCWRVVIDDHHS